MFRRRSLIAVLLTVALAGVAGGVAAQVTGNTVEVRIVAQRLDDGRIEFALQQRDGSGWSDRILPTRRFFPTDSSGRWLSSSPIVVEVDAISDESTVPTPESGPIAQGESCLTTTGCGFGYFDVPFSEVLRVGVDIAPGKWNSDYESAGEDSCYAVRLSQDVRTHPDYPGARSFWAFWFSDLLAVEQPSGALDTHESVIQWRYTDYVRGPRSFTITVLPTDYAIIIDYDCRY